MNLIGIFYSIVSCLNYTRFYIRGQINLNYTFNVAFKVSLKAKAIINGGFIFQFHDAIHSKSLPTLLEMFFRHFVRWMSSLTSYMKAVTVVFSFSSLPF